MQNYPGKEALRQIEHQVDKILHDITRFNVDMSEEEYSSTNKLISKGVKELNKLMYYSSREYYDKIVKHVDKLLLERPIPHFQTIKTSEKEKCEQEFKNKMESILSKHNID